MDKPYNENCAVGKAVRESVAQEILQFASRLAERSDSVSSRVLGKLQPVMLSDRSTGTAICEQVREAREYPPLFEELKSRMQVIENSLQLIESAMSRTEI